MFEDCYPMEFEENVIESNRLLLENFATDLSLSFDELVRKLKLVAQHDKLIAMSIQVNQVYKQNPNAFINFGNYGDNLAKELNIEPKDLIEAVLVGGYNDLLISIINQFNQIYKK
jgi:hypothetical protein